MADENLQKTHSSIVTAKSDALKGDVSHVIARKFVPGKDRLSGLIDKVGALSEEEAGAHLEQVMRSYSGRHRNYKDILQKHYKLAANTAPVPNSFSDTKKQVLGAYCTHEYSIEAAALFNPSMIAHPDQTNMEKGALRFIMSLRAAGEGHISSIVFRTGIIDQNGGINFDSNNRYFEIPSQHEGAAQNSAPGNYDIGFSAGSDICERVIFPVSADEANGIEDARFVRFTDDEGKATYYATYTAYAAPHIQPKLIETQDFLTFKIRTLSGAAATNKGLALFPRKIDGKYAMLSRNDGEHNFIMFSDDLHKWDEAKILQGDRPYWSFMQEGNCGSPIETPNGWLVITHGVGMMREYSIGAMLLDLKDPRIIIATLKEPLLVPEEKEREGYVPNVVYSCGSLIHNGNLVLPYAASDQFCLVATIKAADLLQKLEASRKVAAPAPLSKPL